MEQGHILQIFWGSDPVVKLTLLILIGFSVGSWAVIVYKQKEIKKFRSTSIRFLEAFWRTQNLEDLLSRYAGQESPLFNIFRTAIADLLRKAKSTEGRRPASSTPTGVRRRIDGAVEDEIERVERYLPFLATTGSYTPFIGLFGTVWGILTAFWQIGRAGTTSLAVVGPFIAEALVATAFGLLAAIPAVIAYNYFVAKSRSLIREIHNFGEDLTLRIQKDYFNMGDGG